MIVYESICERFSSPSRLDETIGTLLLCFELFAIISHFWVASSAMERPRKEEVAIVISEEIAALRAARLAELSEWRASLKHQSLKSDDDHSYDFLLSRVQESISTYQEKKKVRAKMNLPLPRVRSISALRTIVLNFGLLCSLVNRNLLYVARRLQFHKASVDMTTNGYPLTIFASISQRNFELTFQTFCRNYLRCSNCSSFRTLLLRDCPLQLDLFCTECSTTSHERRWTPRTEVIEFKDGAKRKQKIPWM